MAIAPTSIHALVKPTQPSATLEDNKKIEYGEEHVRKVQLPVRYFHGSEGTIELADVHHLLLYDS